MVYQLAGAHRGIGVKQDLPLKPPAIENEDKFHFRAELFLQHQAHHSRVPKFGMLHRIVTIAIAPLDRIDDHRRIQSAENRLGNEMIQ
jgi:hypothetical protein